MSFVPLHGENGVVASTLNAIRMSGFNEHFWNKYFAYRLHYVAYIREHAPRRATLAVAAEIARLLFVFSGSLLCALIGWLLAWGAFYRSGLLGWTLVFTSLSIFASFCTFRAVSGITNAVRDLRKFA